MMSGGGDNLSCDQGWVVLESRDTRVVTSYSATTDTWDWLHDVSDDGCSQIILQQTVN